MEYEDNVEQQENSKVPPQLQPHVYRKGQSGNPHGRPPGQSLKEYARNKFLRMTDEEKEDFFNGIPKIDLFKMAEGMPDTKTDLTSLGDKINLGVVVLPAKNEDSMAGTIEAGNGTV